MCVGVTGHIIPSRMAEGGSSPSDGNHGDELRLNIKTGYWCFPSRLFLIVPYRIFSSSDTSRITSRSLGPVFCDLHSCFESRIEQFYLKLKKQKFNSRKEIEYQNMYFERERYTGKDWKCVTSTFCFRLHHRKYREAPCHPSSFNKSENLK